MRTTRLPATIASCALALIALPALALAEPGDMMHFNVTSQVNMPGMAMPPRVSSHDVCMSHKHDARDLAKSSSSHQRDCAITSYKVGTGSANFHMSCSGDHSMEGDASFKTTAAGSHGSMHMTMQNQGHPLTMDVTIDATRTGTCDYTPPAGAR